MGHVQALFTPLFAASAGKTPMPLNLRLVQLKGGSAGVSGTETARLKKGIDAFAL
jgi:hypothetical protein